MCYRPLRISSNNVFRNHNVSCSCYDVPCGKCESCRDDYRNMWKCRLYHEFRDCYDKGGIVVFLTFSFSPACLPVLKVDGVDVPVFNHNDVKTFLNRLKVRCTRKFGCRGYKYFIAMEFGKHTKRQHLHGAFALSAELAKHWSEFVELCRKTWVYGFMFPKFSKIKNNYVDNDGNISLPTLRDPLKSAIYVSKYVTKDISYYSLPVVENAFKAHPELARYYGPKHYQSNNIGISILKRIDTSSVSDVVDKMTNGLTVDYSDSKVPLPRYIQKKLFYYNKFRGRISSTTDKPLYDSLPTELFHSAYALYFERKVAHLCNSIKKVWSRYKLLHSDFVVPSVDLVLLSHYILYFSHVNANVYHSFLSYFGGDISAFSDSSSVGFFSKLSKDNDFLSRVPYHSLLNHSFNVRSIFDDSILAAYKLYLKANSEVTEIQTLEFKHRSEERDKLRYKYNYKFDKSLC